MKSESYDAIEIKNKGFYASNVTLLYFQNSTSKLKLRRALFFLISVSRIFSHEKSCYFVRWLSITNMMIMQTLKRCVGWITLSRMLRMLDNTKVQKSWIFFIFTSLMLYNTVKEKSDFSCQKLRFERLVNLPFNGI